MNEASEREALSSTPAQGDGGTGVAPVEVPSNFNLVLDTILTFDKHGVDQLLVLRICEAVRQAMLASGVALPRADQQGYVDAFYEMAAKLGVEGAQAKSPQQVYAEQVKPALESLKQRAQNAEEGYLNMREWAEQNGLDTTARNGGVQPSDGGQKE